MAVVKKISELTPKGSNLGTTDLLIVGVSNGVDHDLKTVTGAQVLGSAISQTITNGVTSSAPSQNAVFDALALKADVSPVLPATIVDFDTTDPNTIGTVFTPDDQLNEGALYVSSVDFSQWTSDGLLYDTYTAPVVLATEFYLNGTTIDAGSNKTAMIYRNGGLAATSFNTKKGLTSTGAADNDKFWKVFEYSLPTNYTGDSFKLQMNEYNSGSGVGKSVIFNILVKRQDPSTVANVNVESGLSSFDLANFDVLYNSTTKKLSFYYKVTTTYTVTNWLVLNARATNITDIVWSNTLIGASLSGETSDPLTIKTIALNKVNGVYTLPSTAPTAGQVLGYSSSGVSDWVANQDLSGLMVKSNNLSDLTNTTTARTNLGLGSLATQSGTFSGTSSGTNTGDQIISDATITTTDITTNNFSTTKHGFVPKGTNVGNYLKDDGTWGAISAGGLTYFTEAQNSATPNATVNVDSLTAIASTTNADVAIVPKGTGAFTLAVADNTTVGGNKRGINAVDLQTSRTNAAQVASGQYSFASGRLNTASGDYSTAMGIQNIASGGLGCLAVGYGSTASGSSSFATGASTASGASSFASGSSIASGETSVSLGGGNTASGTRSFACGNNSIANGENSTAMGYYSNTFGLKGRWVTCQINTNAGDAQKSIFLLSIRTTGATATTLTSGFGSGAPSAINQVILQNQNALRFKGTIIGKKSGTTDIAAWDVDGLIVRGANAAATTLVVSNVNLVSNTPAWGTPTLAADTTNGGLRVQAIGFATTNIQWTCTIETTEVIYA
jgi:hypothetical protein